MLGRHAFDEALDARQRRTPRDDVDQPGRRIGAEQRSLRTAQDLDALDIGKLARRRAIAGQEYAVEEYARSEEHTSELQSLMRISYAVFCLKKKTTDTKNSQQDMSTYTRLLS